LLPDLADGGVATVALPARHLRRPHLERRRIDHTGNRVAPTVSVVIPALNEERNLPSVLTALPEDVNEILVVDGLSTDRTIEVAKETIPDVRIVRQKGRGKGNALQAGFEAAEGDIVVMLDADGSMIPSEIPAYVAELQNGAEFVKGSRFLPQGGSEDLTPLRKLGNFGLRTTFNLLYGAEHTDLCYGFAAFWRRCLPNLNFHHDGFEVETVLCIRAAQAKLRVHEVPSFERCRQYGQSNLHAVRDGMRILRVLLSGAN
jgi:glycosyltransferase involved in cell wall biosynthesis